MRRKRLVTMLFLLLLVNGCSSLCPGKSGSVSTSGGSAGTIARVLQLCDSARNGLNLNVAGIFADGGGTHEVTTKAYLTNPSATSVTWATDTADAGGPLKGTSGTGTVLTVPDSVGAVWQVDITYMINGKPLTITGRIRKNPNPPPACIGSGTWNLPAVGNGTWSF